MNLATTISLLAGGPGSGCHGANCGRPISAKTYAWMRKQLKQSGIKIPRGASPWDVVKTFDAHNKAKAVRNATKIITKAIQQKHKASLKKMEKKGKLGKKIGTTTPGIVKTKGKEHIDVQPTWKGKVKTQYTTTQGHQVTEIKTPKQYEKSGKSWIGKESPYKGQFHLDLPLFQKSTEGNPKEKNSWFIHQAAPDKAVSVEVHRNLGELRVKVVERTLGEHDAIIQHRQVEFKNVGRAMGFLNRRYGVTYKLK